MTAWQPGRGDFGQVLKLPHGLGNLTTGSPTCSAEHSNRREGFGGAPCMWDASPLHSSEYKLLWAGVGAKHLSQCLTSKNLTPHLTFLTCISQNVYYTIWTTRSLGAPLQALTSSFWFDNTFSLCVDIALVSGLFWRQRSEGIAYSRS